MKIAVIYYVPNYVALLSRNQGRTHTNTNTHARTTLVYTLDEGNTFHFVITLYIARNSTGSGWTSDT